MTSHQTLTRPTPETAAAAEAQRSPSRRRRRGGQSAGSLLAEGQPQLWLTGGALALCVAMILGLLTLVFLSGMSTFWPAALLRVQLRDGTVYLGEVTRDDSYRLSAANLSELPEPVAAEGRRLLQNADTVAMHRRLLRTGNFDLTNTHFHWVADFELDPGDAGLQFPSWALVVERTEWGRFYGEPKSFVLRRERKVGGQELSLLSVIQFLESHQHRLTEAAEQEEFAGLVQPLRQQLEQIRRRNIERFTAAFQPAEGKRIELLLEDRQIVALDQVPAGANVVEAQEVWPDRAEAWARYCQWHDEVRERFHAERRLRKHEIGRVDAGVEHARLAVRREEIDHRVAILPLAAELFQTQQELGAVSQTQQELERHVELTRQCCGEDSKLAALAGRFAAAAKQETEQAAAAPRQRLAQLQSELSATPAAVQQAVREYVQVQNEAAIATAEIVGQMDALTRENARYALNLVTAQGQDKTLSLGEIVRAYPANQLSPWGKVGVYLSRWGEYLWDDPREANTEGGVFPAIWGTVVMTLIMSLAVVPFGVLASLYLREYAKGGPLVSAIRISINNLAGVPSIVYGVFGMGFFCYIIGAYIDGGPKNANLPVLPGRAWTAILAGLAVTGFVAFALSLYGLTGGRYAVATRWRRLAGRAALVAWLVSAGLFVVLLATTPYFHGWFETYLPQPRYGKTALVWASLTLALLTLPVVIVATEEALSAVPNSLREGSYACGAGKWQTIRRIVLPHAMPGIMTGMILAMARGAGEVAPLMLTGAVKLALELPVDAQFPFLHPDRSFMHMGFHIYDLGFQSQNSEAAKPMVFTTTLLLIAIVAALNVTAVWLRTRMRKRFVSSAF